MRGAGLEDISKASLEDICKATLENISMDILEYISMAGKYFQSNSDHFSPLLLSVFNNYCTFLHYINLYV